MKLMKQDLPDTGACKFGKVLCRRHLVPVTGYSHGKECGKCLNVDQGSNRERLVVHDELLGMGKNSLVYRFMQAVLIVIAVPGLALDENRSMNQANQILVERAWSRATPPGVGNGVVYMEISNLSSGDISLVGVSSDRVKRAEIHESVMQDTMMHMQHRKSVVIGPGEQQKFEPGALHIMLMGLQEQLSEGDDFDLTLHFSEVAPIVIRVPVFSIAQTNYPEPG